MVTKIASMGQKIQTIKNGFQVQVHIFGENQKFGVEGVEIHFWKRFRQPVAHWGRGKLAAFFQTTCSNAF